MIHIRTDNQPVTQITVIEPEPGKQAEALSLMTERARFMASWAACRVIRWHRPSFRAYWHDVNERVNIQLVRRGVISDSGHYLLRTGFADGLLPQQNQAIALRMAGALDGAYRGHQEPAPRVNRRVAFGLG